VLLAGIFVAGKMLETDVDHLRRAFEERIWAAIHTLGERLAPDASVTFIPARSPIARPHRARPYSLQPRPPWNPPPAASRSNSRCAA
jgi:hypothetical protein